MAFHSRSAGSLAFALALGVALSGCSETPSAPEFTDPSGDESAASLELLTGRYFHRYIDDFDNDRGTYREILELDDGTTLELKFNGRGPELRPGARIRLRGKRQEGSVAVEDASEESGTAALLDGAGTTVSLAGVTKRVAIVLFNFSNNPVQPYTPAHAAGIAFNNSNSVAAYYRANSWDGVTLVGAVYGWFTIPDANTSCSYTTWATSANKLVAEAGIDLSTASYDHIVYAFPATSACGFSGVGEMPGRRSWLNGSGMSLRTMAHELGHNFGSHHASTWSCTEGGVRVPVSETATNCTTSEYGDPFSIMGASTRRNTNASIANFGWLPAPNRVDVTQTGDYRLTPMFSAAGTQSIRIQRTTSTYYTLEYRQPASTFDTFSSSDPVVNGVTIRLTGSDTYRTQSRLIDTTPATNGFADAPLAVGRTFTDPQTGVTVTTLAVSAEGADVRISFVPDQTAPSQPGALKAAALDPYRIGLSWSASTDNIGVSGYRIFRGSSLVGTTTATSFTDTGLSPSTAYAYQVVAFDVAGNTSAPASAAATTLTPDLVAPTAPTGLRASVSKSRKVTLAWNASTDNVAVTGYQVYRDGQLVATVAGLNYTQSLSRNATVTYYVVAVDAAGNASPRSVSVTVKG